MARGFFKLSPKVQTLIDTWLSRAEVDQFLQIAGVSATERQHLWSETDESNDRGMRLSTLLMDVRRLRDGTGRDPEPRRAARRRGR